MKDFSTKWVLPSAMLWAMGCGAAVEEEVVDDGEVVSLGSLSQAFTPTQPGIRPNINAFSASERTTLANAILTFLTAPVIDEHGLNGHSWHHPSVGEEFFIKHHEYLNQLEAYLLSNGLGQFVPVPEWNPADPIPSQFMVADALVSAPNGAGPPTNQTPNMPVPPQFADSVLCNFRTASDLAVALEGPFHDPVHGAVGGAMASLQDASGVPLFWLWHGLLDDMYHERTWRCETLPAVLSVLHAT